MSLVRIVIKSNPSSVSASTVVARRDVGATLAKERSHLNRAVALSRPKKNNAFWTPCPSGSRSMPSLACSTSAKTRSTPHSKKVKTLPRLERDLVVAGRDAVEIDELCVSKKRNMWLWTAVSRYTGQILAFVVSDRKWHNIDDLWIEVPQVWHRKLVYTDGYGAYSHYFSSWQHRSRRKFDGGTSVVEGVNTSLRHRCGWLVRRSSARARTNQMLALRVRLAVNAHNKAARKRYQKRYDKWIASTQ